MFSEVIYNQLDQLDVACCVLFCCDRCELTALCLCVCSRGMMSQITSREEQIAEYTDRIAAMEEELKKVRESQTLSGVHSV